MRRFVAATITTALFVVGLLVIGEQPRGKQCGQLWRQHRGECGRFRGDESFGLRRVKRRRFRLCGGERQRGRRGFGECRGFGRHRGQRRRDPLGLAVVAGRGQRPDPDPSQLPVGPSRGQGRLPAARWRLRGRHGRQVRVG